MVQSNMNKIERSDVIDGPVVSEVCLAWALDWR